MTWWGLFGIERERESDADETTLASRAARPEDGLS